MVTRLRQGYGGQAGLWSAATYRRFFESADLSPQSKLQDFVPFALVFQHDFAEETNGRHAMA